MRLGGLADGLHGVRKEAAVSVTGVMPDRPSIMGFPHTPNASVVLMTGSFSSKICSKFLRKIHSRQFDQGTGFSSDDEGGALLGSVCAVQWRRCAWSPMRLGGLADSLA